MFSCNSLVVLVPPCAGDNHAYASVLHGKGLSRQPPFFSHHRNAAALTSPFLCVFFNRQTLAQRLSTEQGYRQLEAAQ